MKVYSTNKIKANSAWNGLVNDRHLTELPHYAINKNLPEDSFYTNRQVAKRCIKAFLDTCDEYGIDLENATFVEPSAGEGCFYDFIPSQYDKVGLDIAPKNRHIQRADFLTWYPQQDGRYVVIGNPPFGVRGAMALAFVNRALLFADVVAFILPMSFYSNGKGTNMKRVQGASLIYNEVLPSESFYLPDSGEPVSVNTTFQVWAKGIEKQVFTDYDVSEYVDIYTCCSSPDRYCGLGRGREYDCYIASTFYKDVGIVNRFEDVLYGSGYGLIIKKDKAEVLQALTNANWLNYCSDATNHCKHIRMYHIRKFLGENGFGVAV